MINTVTKCIKTGYFLLTIVQFKHASTVLQYANHCLRHKVVCDCGRCFTIYLISYWNITVMRANSNTVES